MSEHRANPGRDHHEIPPANVLAVTSASEPGATGGCFERAEIPRPGNVDALFVTRTRSPDDRVRAWLSDAEEPPAKVGVVSVADWGRSAAAGQSRMQGELPKSTRTVADPGDLTGVGIAVTELLDEWENDGNRVVVRFESLTAHLQSADVGRVYRFLNEFTARLTNTDAIGCFTVDSTRLDDRKIGLIESLFDDVVRPGENPTSTSAAETTTPAAGERDGRGAGGDAEKRSGFVYPEDESADHDPAATLHDETGERAEPDRSSGRDA